jgi:hypothetical protein
VKKITLLKRFEAKIKMLLKGDTSTQARIGSLEAKKMVEIVEAKEIKEEEDIDIEALATELLRQRPSEAHTAVTDNVKS